MDRNLSQTASRICWGDPRAKEADHRYLEKMQNVLERRLPYLFGRSARTELIADLSVRAGRSSPCQERATGRKFLKRATQRSFMPINCNQCFSCERARRLPLALYS